MGDSRIEKSLPFVLSLLVFIGMYFFSKFSIFSYPHFIDILAATLNIGAIITGFISTVLAVIMGLPNTTLKKLRDTKYINDLVWYMLEAICANMLVVILSLIGFFILDDYRVVFSSAWIASLFYGFSNVVRMTLLMLVLIRTDPSSL